MIRAKGMTAREAFLQVRAQRKIAFASEHADRGDGVYVHCNGGRGRSAVCVLAYMIRAKGMTAREAFLQVRAQRKIAPMLARPLGVPRPQWRALCLFEESERVAGVV